MRVYRETTTYQLNSELFSVQKIAHDNANLNTRVDVELLVKIN